MVRLITIAAPIIFILFLSDTQAAESGSIGPVVLPGSSQYVLHSDAIDEDYLISISLPPFYGASEENFPVVYLVDANSMFTTAASNIRLLQSVGLLPQFVLVGIGYDLRDRNPLAYLTLRYRDMTHVSDAVTEQRLAANPPPFNLPAGSVTGGIEPFIEFFATEIVVFVRRNLRVDTDNQTIIGHSLGGNFALYALLRHPELFDNYVIGSPGLFWGNFSLLNLEQDTAAGNRSLNKKIFISVGDQEDMFDFDNSLRQIASTRELFNRLNSNRYENLQVQFQLFEGHNHISVIPETITSGLMAVLSR